MFTLALVMINFLYITSGGLALFFILLLLGKPKKQIADYILVVLFAVMNISIVTVYFNHNQIYTHTSRLIGEVTDAVVILYGTTLWFYAQAIIRDQFEFTRKDLWHLLPLVIFAIYVFLRIQFDLFTEEYHQNFFISIKLLIISIYIFATLRFFYRFREKRAEYFSFSEEIHFNWFKRVLWGAAIILMVSVVSQFLDGFSILMIPQYGGFFTNLLLCFFIIYIGYYGFRQTTIFLPDYLLEKESTEKKEVQSKQRETDQTSALFQKIVDFMESEKAFLSNDLTLQKLADRMKIPPYQLSQTINQEGGYNFFDFVNRYRVGEVKRRMELGEDHQHTLLAIALDSGFSSKAAFNRAFKKFTGMTPTVYKKSQIYPNKTKNIEGNL